MRRGWWVFETLWYPLRPVFFYAQYNAFYEADRYADGDGNLLAMVGC